MIDVEIEVDIPSLARAVIDSKILLTGGLVYNRCCHSERSQLSIAVVILALEEAPPLRRGLLPQQCLQAWPSSYPYDELSFGVH